MAQKDEIIPIVEKLCGHLLTMLSEVSRDKTDDALFDIATNTIMEFSVISFLTLLNIYQIEHKETLIKKFLDEISYDLHAYLDDESNK